MERYKRMIMEIVAGAIVTAGLATIFYCLCIGIGGR
jgi:hypothetical protein